MTLNRCPDEKKLVAFALGNLDIASVDVLAAHVDGCAECQRRLAHLDDRSDEVVVAIRRGTREGTHDIALSPAMGEPSHPVQSAEKPGTQIGPYRLMELLGEGGFGTVFLAEQTHPIRRRVALKVIKLGMDTRQVLARFQAERQALAMMDHQNIAQVLDAGVSEHGRPYFVMELAKGMPITAYCDENRLSARQRLELFAPVCDAVQHAHTKGVIHRDIKPNNVLITMRDGKPTPKVIDFGVAKAMGGRLTDQTVYTQVHHFIGTPEYISPEQADGGGMDVDARSDIYSLGVLLYELLTGGTPVDKVKLKSRGIERVGQTIRESQPPRPGARMSGEGSREAAERRGADARKLALALRGELDWIVMKCLEHDRTRRYETASALAADVRHYLRGEPVLAGPPGAAYHIRKFLGRHRAAAAAATTTAAAILLGLGVALFGWAHAGHERDAARAAERGEAREHARAEGAVVERDRAEGARRLIEADAVATASPAGAVNLLTALRIALANPNADRMGGSADRARVLAVFQQRLTISPPSSVERLRSACALTALGDARIEEIVAGIEHAPSAEGPLVNDALSIAVAAANPPTVQALHRQLFTLFAASNDWSARSRYAISLMCIGDDRAMIDMLKPQRDATNLAAFAAEFGQWHGDLSRVPELLNRVPEDCRYGLCLAVGRAAQDEASFRDGPVIVAALTGLYQHSASGGVHSACDFALRQWGAPPHADVAPSGVAQPGLRQDWFVNRSGLTMVRAPAGAGLIGHERIQPPLLEVHFTNTLFFSDREVPYTLLRQYQMDIDVPADEKPQSLKAQYTGAPINEPVVPIATNLTLKEAAQFCNWLSSREGRHPCYTLDGDDPSAWICDIDADGYRLPTAPEWEYAARSGTTSRFACCLDGTYLEDFAAVTLTSRHHGGRQPNRWGVFDMLGGAWEMCWDVPMPNRPGSVVVDPRPVNGGRFMIYRGGSVDSGTADLPVSAYHTAPHDRRDDATGFRVVCNGGPPPPAPTVEQHPAATQPGGEDDAVKRKAFDEAMVGRIAGRRLEFATAEAYYAQAAKTKPGESYFLYPLGCLRLYLGDEPGYRDVCRQLIELADRNYIDSSSCDRAAKTLLLNPHFSPGTDLQTAAALADRAELHGQKSPFIYWYKLAVGMARYRAGQFDSAAKVLEQADLLSDNQAAEALIDFYLAMALEKSGKPDEARRAMMRADESLSAHAPIVGPAWGDDWVDWLNCWIARKEARTVVRPAGPVGAQ